MLRSLLIAMVFVPMCVAAARGDDFRCPRCGACRYRSICCPVTEMREKTTYEYKLICEPVCLAGPSEKCGEKCVPDDRCRGFHWETIWKPRCGCVREQRTLAKVPVKKKEPFYTCVYRRVCCSCGFKEGDEVSPPEKQPEETPQEPTPEAGEKLASSRVAPRGVVAVDLTAGGTR
jgi:hypothetical protein